MTTRTTRTTVTFARPFSLKGIDGIQPAGVYDVDTDEELIDDLSFLAYRRVATTIHLRKDGATQVYRVDPVELDACLLRDTGAPVTVASHRLDLAAKECVRPVRPASH